MSKKKNMNTIGIIAEYNPFHNGHAYQICQIKKITGAENIVIVMSGDFVQRGTPAWADKYIRTKMALKAGADFVFELPVVYSTASAEQFARGGVALMNSLGFVDALCFGSEETTISSLQMIADKDVFSADQIQSLLCQGLSYPEARTKLISSALKDSETHIADIMKKPNNILAIEYLKSISLLKSSLTPILINRCDNGYHSLDTVGNFASATAIRNFENLEKIKDYVPATTLKILEKNPERANITVEDFSTLLYYKLRTENTADAFEQYLDVSSELANRIENSISDYMDISEFTSLIKTKQYTYSRVSRALLHILLGIGKDIAPLSEKLKYAPYARLLGMNREKSYLLRNISDITLVTKVADAKSKLDKDAYNIFSKDIYAADLYRQVMIQKANINPNSIPNEYRTGIITV